MNCGWTIEFFCLFRLSGSWVIVLTRLCSCRFPEEALYLNKETWRLIRIGEGQLGFGK